eukprot:874561-Pelagomonas_calceolata.AAC.1
MIIEEWALPFSKKAGFQPASICTAARTDIECACCQICNYPGGLEPINSGPPYLDMYVCDVCQHTYDWKCMTKLGCYTDEHRQEVQITETWACPACASLNNEDKLDRKTNSREELLKASWIPSWEPEEAKTIWPIFHQRMQIFEAQQSKPHFLLPTADLALSNLEIQGFNKLDASNTWKQKSDTELCNKITFDIHPQTDIKSTGSCEFWVQEIDLKPPPNPTPTDTATP